MHIVDEIEMSIQETGIVVWHRQGRYLTGRLQHMTLNRQIPAVEHRTRSESSLSRRCSDLVSTIFLTMTKPFPELNKMRAWVQIEGATEGLPCYATFAEKKENRISCWIMTKMLFLIQYQLRGIAKGHSCLHLFQSGGIATPKNSAYRMFF